jgi:hypothetical protein
MSYAATSDVVAALGRPSASTAETTQWETWLDRVERAIIRAFRRAGLDLDEQIALDEPTVQDVVDVEVAAVIRKIQNPTWGVTSTTRSIDDASVTNRREGGGDSDPLELTDGELTALLPAGRTKARAFSILPN